MPIDAERIREAESDHPVGLVRDAGGGGERLLRPRPVPEVAFEVGDLRPRDHLAVDVLRPELGAGAEIGTHRALRVGRDDDQATSGGEAVGRGGAAEGDAERDDIVPEDGAELVVLGLADEGAAAAQGSDRGDGVGGGTAGNLDRRPHRRVQRFGLIGVDQRHRALVQAVPQDEVVVFLREHVDDGVADSDHVVETIGHGWSPAVASARSIAARPGPATPATAPPCPPAPERLNK